MNKRGRPRKKTEGYRHGEASNQDEYRDPLRGLSSLVNRACDRFFDRRGIDMKAEWRMRQMQQEQAQREAQAKGEG